MPIHDSELTNFSIMETLAIAYDVCDELGERFGFDPKADSLSSFRAGLLYGSTNHALTALGNLRTTLSIYGSGYPVVQSPREREWSKSENPTRADA